MENKHNFMSIIILVIVAVILLTAIPILTNMSTDCSHNIGQLNINPDFSSGDYFVDKGSYDYIESATIIKDENLIPENIKKDVNIFGVVGTYEGSGSDGGYDVFVRNGGGGNYISLLVKFSDGKGLSVRFPGGLPGTSYDDIELKNVVWLRVLDYGVTWDDSVGITEAQATDSAGYTLTENVEIYLRD